MKIYTIEPDLPAQACIIWMHGLGADAQDMMGLARALHIKTPVKHVFLDAPVRPVTLNNGVPMRAWYDIVSLTERDKEDKEGVLASAKGIEAVIEAQLEDGFDSRQMMLAGFSQGGAMALFTALQSKQPLGGVLALSAYLPLMAEIDLQQASTVPIFMAAGLFDPVVVYEFSQKSKAYLQQRGYTRIDWHEYPMEHAISTQELEDLSAWLNVMTAIDNGGRA